MTAKRNKYSRAEAYPCSERYIYPLFSCGVQVIKAYPQGKMSTHIHSLEVGDSLEIKGPMSKLPYTPNMKQKIGMVSRWPFCPFAFMF